MNTIQSTINTVLDVINIYHKACQIANIVFNMICSGPDVLNTVLM